MAPHKSMVGIRDPLLSALIVELVIVGRVGILGN